MQRVRKEMGLRDGWGAGRPKGINLGFLGMGSDRFGSREPNWFSEYINDVTPVFSIYKPFFSLFVPVSLFSLSRYPFTVPFFFFAGIWAVAGRCERRCRRIKHPQAPFCFHFFFYSSLTVIFLKKTFKSLRQIQECLKYYLLCLNGSCIF
jgi:hypothetical protein